MKAFRGFKLIHFFVFGFFVLGGSAWADPTWYDVLSTQIAHTTYATGLDMLFDNIMEGKQLSMDAPPHLMKLSLTEAEKAGLITELYLKGVQLSPPVSAETLDRWSKVLKSKNGGIQECFHALRVFHNSQFVSQANDCTNLGAVDLQGDILSVCKRIAPIISKDVQKGSGTLWDRGVNNMQANNSGTAFALGQAETGQSSRGATVCTSVGDRMESKALSKFFKYSANPDGAAAQSGAQ